MVMKTPRRIQLTRMIHPSPKGRPAKEVSNGSANDVCQSMKQSLVGRVPVLGTLVQMSKIVCPRICATNPKKTWEVVEIKDLLRMFAMGKQFFSPFGRICLKLFPRTLSKSKKKGWDDGERKVGRVVVDFCCLGGFKYWCLIYPPSQ